MRKVILYIAMSLDGYIADQKGGIGWLAGQDKTVENEDTYSAFIEHIDTILMGWNTYDQVRTELSPEEWVYAGRDTYVFTHRSLPEEAEIHFTAEEPARLVKRLLEKPGKDIWVCGGARVVDQLMAYGLIDRFHIAVIPVLLGSGIRLFQERSEACPLRLAGTRSYNGICELIYDRRDI